MAERSERTVVQAREVAVWLKEQGHPDKAERILKLCRSATSLRETASRLHDDNAALRAGKL